MSAQSVVSLFDLQRKALRQALRPELVEEPIYTMPIGLL
jgi:hypothetical protein